MKKMLKARKGGFTLVELLIVITIIGALSGMMMMSMSATTDSADAAKMVSDLEVFVATLRTAMVDRAIHLPNGVQVNNLAKSLDSYLDAPAFTIANPVYTLEYVQSADLALAGVGGGTMERAFIGIRPTADGGTIKPGVKTKLQTRANSARIYTVSGTTATEYDGANDSNAIYQPILRSY